MTKFKVCGCYYTKPNNKTSEGIAILNRKTNTRIIVNKKLEIVKDAISVVTCESSIGNIMFDL